jgi:hypothetical protein
MRGGYRVRVVTVVVLQGVIFIGPPKALSFVDYVQALLVKEP